MIRTYKYRLYPQKKTEDNYNNILSYCNILYNLCIEQKKYLYSARKYQISMYEQINQLPELKKAFLFF